MDPSILHAYNPWWEPYTFPKVFARPSLEASLEQLMPTKTIILLTGLRRVGKTSLMKLCIEKLIKSGSNPDHILYISLDDYALNDISLLDIVSEFRKIQQLPHDQMVTLFLDEITSQQDFRQQLKTLYDRGHCKVIASSSSASALRDNKSWLTGRVRHIDVQPLNFDEFLHFKNIQLKKRDDALRESYFEEYMQIGGMPEYVLTGDREYLVALLDDIIYKDIIAHYNIKQPQVIRDYLALLMERSGKQISLNKVSKILNISPDTAKRYLSMFEETYLIYLVPRHGKTNERILSPKKVYAADIGLRHLLTGFRDKGAIFENIVFFKIKHKNPSYYYKNGIELDFITEDDILIEVKYGRKLNEKQQALFDAAQCKQKIVIANINDLKLLQDI